MTTKQYIVMRRVLAWILLVFFVLLFINIMVIQWYLTESVIAYCTIVALFFLTKGLSRGDTYYETGGDEGDGGNDPGGAEGNSGDEDQQ